MYTTHTSIYICMCVKIYTQYLHIRLLLALACLRLHILRSMRVPRLGSRAASIFVRQIIANAYHLLRPPRVLAARSAAGEDAGVWLVVMKR